MKFPIFASFIVFVVWLTYEIRKHRNIEEKGVENFWDRESKSNITRKQSLEHLSYIQIPYTILSLSLLSEIEEVTESQNILFSLREKKIVNLTGISNTDLKFTYGAPNLPLLTEYDQNYTLLVRNVQKIAEYYSDNGYKEDAIALLEFAISTNTDVSKTYRLLAALYTEKGESYKITDLLSKAQNINGIMKNSIVRTLQEFYP